MTLGAKKTILILLITAYERSDTSTSFNSTKNSFISLLCSSL